MRRSFLPALIAVVPLASTLGLAAACSSSDADDVTPADGGPLKDVTTEAATSPTSDAGPSSRDAGDSGVDAAPKPLDAGHLDGGQVISGSCQGLAEGMAQCTAGPDLNECQDGMLVAYTCPNGSYCALDTTSVDGVSCLCDDQSDSICPDPSCTMDPDCSVDAGGGACTPMTFAPAAPNILPANGSVPQPGNLAVSGDMVFASVTYGGQPLAATRILGCAASGCGATPLTFGKPDTGATDVGLVVVGNDVFWTEQDGNGAPDSYYGDVLQVANLDGTNERTVLQIPQGYLYPRLASDGTGNVFIGGGSSTTNTAGTVYRVPLTGSPASFVSTGTSGFSATVIAASSTYVAYWAATFSGSGDGKIHVVDVTGAEVGSVGPFDHVTSMSMDAQGNLVWTGYETSLHSLAGLCSLPACANPVDLVASLPVFRGFALALSGGEMYFGAALPDGCGYYQGLLARCSTADAFAGTCMPEYLASGIEWVNALSIAVGSEHVFASFKTSRALEAVALP
jgi:hypothetical protein